MVDLKIMDKRWSEKIQNIESLTTKIVTECFQQTECDISFVFTDDDFIRTINKNYRNIDAPTNVLSFNYSEAHNGLSLVVGEVLISFDRIMHESKEYEIPFLQHCKHILVHGVLHIMGYDHDNLEKHMIMQNKENEILEKLL